MYTDGLDAALGVEMPMGDNKCGGTLFRLQFVRNLGGEHGRTDFLLDALPNEIGNIEVRGQHHAPMREICS